MDIFNPRRRLPDARVPGTSAAEYMPWSVGTHRLTNLLILSCDTRAPSLHKIAFYSFVIIFETLYILSEVDHT